ncbi:hypothetical protein ACFXAW_09785, partial [Streptomyces sp. NPDC059445]
MGSWRHAEVAVVPPALRLRLGLIAVLAASTVLALGVLYAGDSEPGPVDERIGTAAYDVGSPWRRVALALDFLGEPAGATALVVILMAGCLLLRRPRAAALVAARARGRGGGGGGRAPAAGGDDAPGRRRRST